MRHLKIIADDSGVLQCPRCVRERKILDAEVVYLISASVKRGGDVTVIDSAGVRGERAQQAKHEGGKITVDALCRAGHAFRLYIGAHLDQSYVWTDELPDLPTTGVPVNQLWDGRSNAVE